MRFYPNILAIAGLALLAAPACAADPQQQQQLAGTQVFQLPEGARVHDVAPAPDGTIWYTAQRQGALGILDPKTGKTRAGSARPGIGAARRDPGAGRRGVDHRQRAECDRPVRSEDGEAAISGSCRQTPATPTSTPAPSTATAFTGSPARTGSTAVSIRRPARWTFTRTPTAAAPMASPRRLRAISIMSRSPAAISRGSTARPARRRSSNRRPRLKARAAYGPTARAICGCPNGIAAI